MTTSNDTLNDLKALARNLAEAILDDDLFTDAPERAEAVAWLREQAEEMILALGLQSPGFKCLGKSCPGCSTCDKMVAGMPAGMWQE